jgi:DNA polymerase-3 subunit epsilon
MTNVLYFDTETTGIPNYQKPADDPVQPHLLSIAGILCSAAGTELATYYSLVKPEGWEIDETGIPFKVNGIGNAQAQAEGKPLAEVMTNVAAMHDQADVLVAYGMHFDAKILRGAYRRCGMDDRYHRCLEWCAQNAAANACRIMATERMHEFGHGKSFKKPKLAEAYEILLGEKFVKAHDALEDVRALRRIVLKIREIQRDVSAELSTGEIA